LTSAQLIGKALESVGIGYKKAAGMKVVMVAHNTLADIAGLGDRKTFMPLFKVVRRTMVTLGGDRQWRADFGNGNYAKVLVRMADTWLLAPQKQGSLSNISAYLKRQKVKIESHWYTHMDDLLAQHPQLFADYARGYTGGTGILRKSARYVPGQVGGESATGDLGRRFGGSSGLASGR
jgi:hypothetical protein